MSVSKQGDSCSLNILLVFFMKLENVIFLRLLLSSTQIVLNRSIDQSNHCFGELNVYLNIKICTWLTRRITNKSNFQPLEVNRLMGETQLQVGENWDNLVSKGLRYVSATLNVAIWRYAGLINAGSASWTVNSWGGGGTGPIITGFAGSVFLWIVSENLV